MQAITKLNEEGLVAAPSITISQINLYEIPEFTKHFVNQGIPVLYSIYSYDNHREVMSFGIGGENSEFDFTDKEGIARLCDGMIKLKKERTGVLVTNKTLMAIKELFLNKRRTWTCKALSNFLIIDNYGRVAGCHLKQPVASIFELPKLWHSPTFKNLRKEYENCKDCAYLCYIFYSLHPNGPGAFEIILDQWKNMLRCSIKLRNNH
jgi:MoaA/NifB/PqqE/SkfB family radical SAM enzyme